MSFYKINSNKKLSANMRYLKEGKFFSLIAAVLNGRQTGTVFANSCDFPTSFFVEHKFGFSQIFGSVDSLFLNAIHQYLAEEQFSASKIRLYAPCHSLFLLDCAELSERCQFRLKNTSTWTWQRHSIDDDIKVVDINSENICEVDRALDLDLSCRFWNSGEDFLSHSMGQAIMYNGKCVSACYAAAVAERIAEIDVATLPTYRKRGFGAFACSAFITKCLDRGIIPNWDCFTNNEGSLRLAKNLGFEKYGEPYPFFTLNKKKEGSKIA